MNLRLLLEMAASGSGDRVALGSHRDGLTFEELARRARVGGGMLRSVGAGHVLFLGRNGPALPQVLFAAAAAGVPFTPLNYRLAADQLAALAARFAQPFLVVDADYRDVLPRGDLSTATEAFTDLLAGSPDPEDSVEVDDGSAAVQLFTSGTTAEPKIVSLSHDNLASYVIGTVEFDSAGPDDATLTTTPPYHIAAVASVLSNVFACRRVVYLPDFDAAAWLRLLREEQVTTAMLVPTMLDRVLAELDGRVADAPCLRTLSYGGARANPSTVEAAMAAFPGVDFVNAYGLTETSSTVALLTPADHRAARESEDPRVRRRLSSVGRPVPGVQAEIRDADGVALGTGEPGELWLRGPQVSGRYVGQGSHVDGAGWFPTRDRAWADEDGYLFVEGRADDTIIRGGENIAPSEIEDVLRRHPDVADVAVVGVPDEQWGHAILAAVVRRPGRRPAVEEVRDYVRARLRGSRTPDVVQWVGELPYSPTGKLLRREVLARTDVSDLRREESRS